MTDRTVKDMRQALFENQKGYLTYKQLASILGLTERTLRRYVNLRKIPVQHVGRNARFIPSEIAAWLAKQHGAAS